MPAVGRESDGFGGSSPPSEMNVRASDPLKFLAERLGRPPDRLQPPMRLGRDLHLDSLAIVELLTAMETELGLDVDSHWVDEDTTVSDLIAIAEGTRSPGEAFRGGRWPLMKLSVAVRAVLFIVWGPLIRLLSVYRVRGLEHLRGLDGPVLFAANHLSLLDNPAILVSLPWRWRLRLVTAAADGVLDERGRVQRVLAMLLSNAFPLAQSGQVHQSMKYCKGLVDAGWSVLYFPEGRRSETGALLEFKSGIGMLAVQTGRLVVPVRIKGTEDVMPMGARCPRRGVIEVTFGQPLRFNPDTPYAEATQSIRNSLAALASEGEGYVFI